MYTVSKAELFSKAKKYFITHEHHSVYHFDECVFYYVRFCNALGIEAFFFECLLLY